MNSIFDTVLSGGSRIILYADDMVLYKPIKNNQDLLDFQNDIDAICSWTSTNSLHLNATKTKSILITRKKHRPILNFVIGSYPIPSVTSLKFLGVVITDNLSWSSHIESTCLKAKKQLGLIHRHYHQAPRVARERLYKLTVLPHLDYCASVWDPHQAKYKEKLNSVQAFASKVVLQSWTTPRQQRLSMLKWPCLEDRRKVQKLIMCHKIINGRSCIPSSTFSQHPYPSLRHSHSFPLFVPQSHSVSHRSSFFISVVPLWNSLPSTIPLASSAVTFKSHVVAYMY